MLSSFIWFYFFSNKKREFRLIFKKLSNTDKNWHLKCFRLHSSKKKRCAQKPLEPENILIFSKYVLHRQLKFLYFQIKIVVSVYFPCAAFITSPLFLPPHNSNVCLSIINVLLRFNFLRDPNIWFIVNIVSLFNAFWRISLSMFNQKTFL